MKNKYKIGFSNQSTGLLFKDLVEDLGKEHFPSILYTGNNFEKLPASFKEKLNVDVLNPYIRTSNFARLFSGLKYLTSLFIKILSNKFQLFFIVSNPPFIGLLALLFKKFSNQRYVILVYDIYPDILISLDKILEKNLIVRIWRKINRKIYEESDAVITIGNVMKKELENHFDPKKTLMGEVISIPNCADPKSIMPIPKENNNFSKKYNQIDKLTVMYSGNFGNSHSFKMILDTAKKLKNDKFINFFLIGEGAQKSNINARIITEKLSNVVSLPWQNKSIFAESLASSDIALITMAIGTENLMIPSKIYYSMAVGSALIGIAKKESELANIINDYDCGIIIDPDNSIDLKRALLKFKNDASYLKKCKNNSYNAFKNNFTRLHMSKKYGELIKKVLT